MAHSTRRLHGFLATMAAAAGFLAACGGGSGGTQAPPPRPTLRVPPGVFDTGFGQGGIFTLELGASPPTVGVAARIVAEPSGHVWFTGFHYVQPSSFPTANAELFGRLDPNGSLDTSLAGMGFVRTPIDPASTISGTWVSPRTDGGAVLAQSRMAACLPTGCPNQQSFVARKVNRGGVIDLAYGSGGSAAVDVFQDSVVEAPDGSILIFGTLRTEGSNPRPQARRLDPAGVPDEGFAARATAALQCDAQPEWSPSRLAAAMLPDGKILVAGVVIPPMEGGYLCIMRLNADGTLDPAFGSAGRTRTTGPFFSAFFATPAALLAQSDGTTVVIVRVTTPGAGTSSSSYLLWLTADGRYDRGIRLPLVDVVTSATLQRDGKILMTGLPGPPPGVNDRQPRLVRLLPTGDVDTTFGAEGLGYASLTINGGRIYPWQVIATAGDTILVSGLFGPPGFWTASDTLRAAVARLGG